MSSPAQPVEVPARGAFSFPSSSLPLDPAENPRSRDVGAAVLTGLPLVALLSSSLVIVLGHMTSSGIGAVDLGALAVLALAGLSQTILVHERGRLLDDSRKARAAVEIALGERAQADSRYRVLVEHVPAAVYIDVADDGVTDGGRLGYMSPQIEVMLGYRPDELIGDPELWPSLIHPDDRDGALAAYHEHWRSGRPLRAEYRMIARDGSTIWVRDEAYGMADETASGRRVSQGLLVDTTEQKRMEERLLHDALHDPLTGLANRVLFRDRVERALSRLHRRRTTVALLFLDVDDFKVVNDSLGHAAGDRLLIEIARRLTRTIRAGDVAARQGGDEFTVLVGRVGDVGEATAMAERVAAVLRRPIELEGRSLAVGVSIGVALASETDGDADALLSHADAAMYTAKANGKGRYAVFEPSMQVRARQRLDRIFTPPAG